MLHFRYDILGLDPIHVYNGLKQLLSLTGRALSSLPCGDCGARRRDSTAYVFTVTYFLAVRHN